MIIPQELKRFNLITPQAYKRRRLVMTSEAETGTGKSDFVLRTAPRKKDGAAEGILVIDLDRNIEPLEDRYAEATNIMIHKVHIPIALDQEKDHKVLLETRDLILKAIELDTFRTIFVDTGSALYDLARRGFFGSMEFGDVPQAAYSTLNSFFFKLFNAAKEKRVNFCMSHHVKDEFKTTAGNNGKARGTKTGKKEMHSWSHIMESTQCHVIFSKDPAKDDLDRFKMKIIKCNANPLAEGIEFYGGDISWANLGVTVYPFTTEEDWA